jgi:hypothetical protein
MPLRPPISIRHLMAMILLIAVFLGLAIPAVEVYQAKEHHTHLGIDMSEPPTLSAWGGIQPPFWPRYLKRLTGRPWRHQPCGFKTGYESDRCEFAYPEMVVRVGKHKAYQFDSEQGDRLEEILKQRAKKSP